MADIRKAFALFGGNVETIFYDIDDLFADDLFEAFYLEALRLQKIFNLFDPESELSLLNVKRSMPVSAKLLCVIDTALTYCRDTAGCFDISKGRQIIERKAGKPLTPVSCTFRDIEISDGVVTLNHPDVLIDLGAIAKGYIVDSLVDFLKNKGVESALIDARGDIRIFGSHLEVIGVQHPRDSENALCNVVIEDCTVATSGDYKQFNESYETCHVLGKKQIISATVVGDSLMHADAIATSLLSMDINNVKLFVENMPEFKVMIIDKDLNVNYYNDFHKLFPEEEIARIENKEKKGDVD